VERGREGGGERERGRGERVAGAGTEESIPWEGQVRELGVGPKSSLVCKVGLAIV
jgi:hypothetical protein